MASGLCGLAAAFASPANVEAFFATPTRSSPYSGHTKGIVSTTSSSALSLTEDNSMTEHNQIPRWVRPKHTSICEKTGVTLSRYMMEMAR
jgi:hypothetical protein